MRRRIFLFGLLFIVFSLRNADAQWIPTGGPIDLTVNCFQKNGNVLYTATSNGLYSTSLDTINWNLINTPATNCYSIAFMGNVIFLATDAGFFYSDDNGQQWLRGLDITNTTIVSTFVVFDSMVFAGTDKGVYLSYTLGQAWNFSGLFNRNIISMAASGNLLIAGLNSAPGVYVSSDTGASWQIANNGLPASRPVNSLTALNGKLYAGTSMGVYISSDDGNNWNSLNNGLPPIVRSLTPCANKIYAGTDEGIFFLQDGDSVWSEVSLWMSNKDIQALYSFENYIFAGTINGGVYISEDNGNTWNIINQGLVNTQVNTMVVNGSEIFAAAYPVGIFVSSDDGRSWRKTNSGWQGVSAFNCMEVFKDHLFASQYQDGLYVSVNEGNSWEKNSLTGFEVNSFCYQDSTLYAACSNNGIIFSTNVGNTWTNKTIDGYTLYVAANDKTIFASGSALYRSDDKGVTWTWQQLPGMAGGVFAEKDKVVDVTGQGLAVSSDNGYNWDLTSLTSPYILSCVIKDNTIVAGSIHEGIFISYDFGANWQTLNSGLTNLSIYYLVANDTFLFAGTEGNGVYKRSWSEILGESENHLDNDVKLFPNPASDKLNIDFDLNYHGNISVTLLDISGRKLLQTTNIHETRIQLDVKNFRSGVYLVKVQNEYRTEVKKLIIQ